MFLFLTTVRAAYFERLPYTIAQPGGKTINCFVSGDEFFNWIHDAEGYTIIQASNGYYYYAELKDEILKPSSYLVNAVKPSKVGLSKWAKISKAAYQQRKDEFYIPEKTNKNGTVKAPHSGTMNNLVIYIRFADDAEFSTTRQVYDNNFNPPTGVSLKSYYKEVSYDNLTINSTHYPACAITTNLSYQDYHPRNYFQPFNLTTNPNGYKSIEKTGREHQLLADAIDWINANSPVPATLDIDADNDNNIDNVCFIIKGNSGAWNNLLWAHRWSLYSQTVEINGKRVYGYTFQPENQVNVRTLCHEMFHALGAPDLYHYTNQGVISPAGSWDLMESGGGHMMAYMKWKYSNKTWINSIPKITTTGTYTLNPLSSSTDNCFRIASPYSNNEYFMVEYRNQAGTYESNIPGSGLIVYRIDSTLNGNSNGPPDEVYLYRPGGSMTVDGNTNTAYLSSNVGRTAMNDNTDPDSFLQTGGIGGLNISNVTNADTTISFDVTFPQPCTPPTVQASAFTSSALSYYSMTIGFDRGNGDSVIVFARAGKAVNAIPVNGTIYNADTVLGTGIQIGSGIYVAYKGTASSINLSSLVSGTTYYYAVFEYNSTTKCYKTPALTGNAKTLCIPLTIVSQPITSQTSCTPTSSITLSMASSLGSTPISYKWQYNNNGTWANVTNGTPSGASYTNGSTANMTVSEITNADIHQYRCNLSNCNATNTATSNIASITANLTPPIPVIVQVSNTLYSSSSNGNQWYNSNIGILNGANGNSYNPSQNGNYFVVVTINNCESPDKSNTIYYNNTAIEESNTNLFNVKITPNPFTDKTNITYTLSDFSQVNLSIIDFTGKELSVLVNENQSKGEHNILFTAKNFASGLYFYKLRIDNTITTGKLLIGN